jgi:hypothetical protein
MSVSAVKISVTGLGVYGWFAMTLICNLECCMIRRKCVAKDCSCKKVQMNDMNMQMVELKSGQHESCALPVHPILSLLFLNLSDRVASFAVAVRAPWTASSLHS